jgi:hypothetical protein
MNFRPTYLYIKQHALTGKCYFGKTTSSDPVKYAGSGKHWVNHLKKHGYEHVETLWYCLFYEQEDLKKFALLFSDQQDIVKSDHWLNLMVENGLDGPGRMKGHEVTKETRAKISKARTGNVVISESTKAAISERWKGREITSEHRAIISATHKGKVVSEETCAKLSNAAKSRQILTCPHCHKFGMSSNMMRYHFDNCKVLNNG